LLPSKASVTGMNPIADSTVETATALYSAFMIEPVRPIRAKNVPMTEAMTPTPPSARGNTTRPEDGKLIAPRNMTATAVTA
jgi:hypothetical protein